MRAKRIQKRKTLLTVTAEGGACARGQCLRLDEKAIGAGAEDGEQTAGVGEEKNSGSELGEKKQSAA